MIKRQTTICLCGLLLPFSTLWAQAVKGEVTGSDLLPLERATVIGLNSKDSTFITGTVTDRQGDFILPLRHKSTYLLKVSAIGYKTQYIYFNLTDTSTVGLGRIIMKEDTYTLSDVTITAQKVPVEIKAGKTVYNLSSTLYGTQGNLYDALKQMPGVQVQSNGNILMNGQGGVNVLMNGKTIYLTGDALANYLRGIPASTIEKIELINNPPAHLDAAGKTGVINIETKKISIKGMVTGGNASCNQADIYRSGNGNIYLNLRKSKFNIYTGYAYHQGTDPNETTISRKYLAPGSLEILNFHIRQQSYRTYSYRLHNLRIATQYDLSPHVQLNAHFNGSRLDRLGKEQLVSDFYSYSAASDSSSTTQNRIQTWQQNLIGGVSATYQPSSKLKWNTTFDFQLFENNSEQDQQSHLQANGLPGTPKNSSLKGNLEGNIRIYCGQSDLNLQLSEKTTFGIGGKTIYVTINNAAIYHDKVKETWQTIESLNNHFIYHENINAGYLTLNSTLGKYWKIETGLRAENTNIKGKTTGNTLHADSSFTNRYIHLFPFLQMQWQWKKTHQLSLLYSRRIVCPNYRDLSPFVTVNDNYLHEQGNTQLKPELVHNSELSYILKNRYLVTLLTSYTRHPIAKSYIAEGDKRILVLPMNLTSNFSTGIRLNAANLKPFPWWQINANLMFIHQNYAWEADDKEYKNKKLTSMIYIGHQFHFPKGWAAELNGYRNGNTPQGQAVISPVWSISAGIGKSIWKKRATWRVFAEDLFSSRHIHIDVFSTAQQGWYNEKKRMKIGISFSFNLHKGENIKDFAPQSNINENKRINL